LREERREEEDSSRSIFIVVVQIYKLLILLLKGFSVHIKPLPLSFIQFPSLFNVTNSDKMGLVY